MYPALFGTEMVGSVPAGSSGPPRTLGRRRARNLDSVHLQTALFGGAGVSPSKRAAGRSCASAFLKTCAPIGACEAGRARSKGLRFESSPAASRSREERSALLGAGAADARDFDDGVVWAEAALVCDLGQQRF